MTIFFVVSFLLDGVRQRVPEIQNAPQARFAFVRAYDLSLDFAGTLDDVRQRLQVAPKNFIGIVFKIRKKFFVADDAVLDDFAESRLDFAFRQRRKALQIDKHRAGLVKRADKIFAKRVIDGSLAADA